jgi:hypothetical protein
VHPGYAGKGGTAEDGHNDLFTNDGVDVLAKIAVFCPSARTS